MIPVTPQEEPDDFDVRVRQPGTAMLLNHSEWTGKKLRKKGYKYWKHALSPLYKKYSHICAYSVEWMPPTKKSIDHFVPLITRRDLAFEWCNYRLASTTLNENKGDHTVLDPFLIEAGWFEIDYPSLLLRPNPNLDNGLQESIRETINKLKFNEFTLLNRRIGFLRKYREGEALDALSAWAPFFVSELRRHGQPNFFTP